MVKSTQVATKVIAKYMLMSNQNHIFFRFVSALYFDRVKCRLIFMILFKNISLYTFG